MCNISWVSEPSLQFFTTIDSLSHHPDQQRQDLEMSCGSISHPPGQQHPPCSRLAEQVLSAVCKCGRKSGAVFNLDLKAYGIHCGPWQTVWIIA